MPKVVEYAEMQFVAGNSSLRDFSVVAPGAGIRRGIARCDMRILFSNKETTGKLQEVRMRPITPVEKLHVSVNDVELAQQDRRRLALIFVPQ